MKLYSYVMNNDTGFVPNPFWGYCTCAACTPTHKKPPIKLNVGNWLTGNTSAAGDNERRLYAMRITEPPMDFDAYYRDARIAMKKPRKGDHKSRCGDNMYFRDSSGTWKQHRPAFYHLEPERFTQDTQSPRVFISEYFFYFGGNAPVVPTEFQSLLCIGIGIRKHEGNTVSAFVKWLERTFPQGINGQPRDTNLDSCCGNDGPCELRPASESAIKKPRAR